MALLDDTMEPATGQIMEGNRHPAYFRFLIPLLPKRNFFTFISCVAIRTVDVFCIPRLVA